LRISVLPTIVAFTAYCGITLLYWLPYGFNIAEFSDLWAFYRSIEAGEYGLFYPDGLRPLMAVPTFAAYTLFPDSFLGANIFVALLMIGKSALLYTLVRLFLPAHRSIAFLAGALYLVFPVDTGLFWLVAGNIHWFVFGTLAACTLFVWHLRKPAVWKWPLIFLAQFAALSYEASFPVLLAFPIVVLAIEPNRLRWLRLVLLFWILPVLLGIRYAFIFVSIPADSGAYQTSLLAPDTGQMLERLRVIYQDHLATGWIQAAVTLSVDITSAQVVAALAAALIVASVTLWFLRVERPPTWRTLAALLVVGLGIIFAGVAAILPTVVRDVNYRVFFFSGIGAALALIAALYTLSGPGIRFRQLIFILGMSGPMLMASRLPIAAGIALATLQTFSHALKVAGLAAVFAALGAASIVAQHGRYVSVANAQGWMLGSIVGQVPGLPETVPIVILDERDQLGYEIFEWRRDIVQSSLAYIYEQRAREAFFCIESVPYYGFFREQCRIDGEDMVVIYQGRETRYRLSDLVIFRYDGLNGAELLSDINSVPTYQTSESERDLARLPQRMLTLYPQFPMPRPNERVSFDRLR
jgi:hypothetical protein